jgi:hypothetical protein
MRKASTWMLEKGIQTPSPSPDHIPAQNHKLLLRTYIETGTSNGGTSKATSAAELDSSTCGSD